MILIGSFSKGKWSEMKKAIGGLQLGHLGLLLLLVPLSWPGLLMLQTWELLISWTGKESLNIFFEESMRSCTESMINCLMLLRHSRGTNLVGEKKWACIHLAPSIIQAHSNWRNWCQQSCGLGRGNFHTGIVILNTWQRRATKHSYSFSLAYGQ